MDPLCISLVYQYLESTKSSVTGQFKTKHQAKETNVKLGEVLSKWNEDQLIRSIVYQHLRRVAPSLALEFMDTRFCSLESVPEKLVELVKVSQQITCGTTRPDLTLN